MRQLPKNKIITIAQLTILACAPLLFAGGGDLSLDTVDKIRMEFKTDSHTRAMYNSITNNEVRDLALNRDVLRGHNKIYSHKIKTKGVTNQKSSGRCWLFAGLNVMRPAIIKKYKLDEFEFSQNYLAFWDKMEKANLFLERIIGFAERDIMDRDMVIILKYPCQDGGDWEYVTYLIKKYGAVPKDIMPKTNSSSSTGAMNKVLSNKLRADAAKLRMMSKDGKSIEQLRAQKKNLPQDRIDKSARDGLLFASGLITGEALTGILLAIPIVLLVKRDITLPLWKDIPDSPVGKVAGIAILVGIAYWLYRTIASQKEN